MANTSKYIKIQDEILCEYIYTDQADPESLDTDTYGIEILTNGYTGTNYMFSAADTSNMNNLRTYSSVPNGTGGSYAYLTTNLPVKYNDYDSNLTDSDDLGQTFSPSIEIKYDVLRIHLSSGFDFAGHDGLIFEIQVTQKDHAKVNLASFTFLRGDDDFLVLNPDPFLIAEQLYTSYIDLKIPAAFYFMQDVITDFNTLGSKLTSSNPGITGASTGVGFIASSSIDIVLRAITETTRPNSFYIFATRELSSTSIEHQDIYTPLVARIQESAGGDYYEVYGEYNGVIYEDFISSLEAQPNSKYMVFHELTVNEQLGSTFYETNKLNLVQTSNWEDPIIFRPVILNSATAVSYSITYLMRLVNTIDNSQIIRNSQLTSNDVKKYGRTLPQINLGTVPTIAKVYNKTIESNELYQINVGEDSSYTSTVIKREFVNVYMNNKNIKVSTSQPKVSYKNTEENINDILLEQEGKSPNNQNTKKKMKDGTDDVDDIRGGIINRSR